MKWISVKDKLPEFNKKVLGYDTQRIYICFREKTNEYNEHWKICDEDCICNGCTGAIIFWMELPKFPDENKKESDFKDLGPINPKKPNAHAFVYRPENYPGPIALNATVRKEKDDL